MKSRKTLKHNELIQDTLKAITMFRPDPVMIKRRIGDLIERDFLERDPKDRGNYIYKP